MNPLYTPQPGDGSNKRPAPVPQPANVPLPMAVPAQAAVVENQGNMLVEDSNKRRRKVRILNTSHYEIIDRVEQYFEEEKNLPQDPDLSKVEERLSLAVGFPVSAIRAAEQKYGSGPAGRRSRKVEHVQRVSPQELALIRLTYHELMTGKAVTVKMLHNRLQERYGTAPAGKVPWSETTLWRILKDDLGYTMGKRNPPQEPEPSAGVRNSFIRMIRELRMPKPPIVYVGELIIAEGLWSEASWETGDYPVACAISNQPSARCGIKYFFIAAGGRLAESQYGFVPNTVWMATERPKTEQFMSWFESKLVPNVPPKTLIVLNSGNDIGQGGIVKPAAASGAQNAPVVEASVVGGDDGKVQYRTDEVAAAARKGLRVVRLPPKHRELNAIEPVWHQVKTTVRIQGDRSAEGGIPRLVEEAIKTVQPQDWNTALSRVEDTERAYASQPVGAQQEEE